jgi:hypothetical protein
MKVRLPQNRKNVLQQPLCSEEDEEVTFMLVCSWFIRRAGFFLYLERSDPL